MIDKTFYTIWLDSSFLWR